MSRQYTLKKRAEQVADTRRRIVEATVELHGDVGPAATTLSMIAERAGVQRHTLYAHFPDERSLFLACSGLALERDPLPDAAPWAEIADVRERLCSALTAVYGWYARNERLAACVLRDAEHHALTQEIAELRFGPPMIAYRRTLGAGLNRRQQALLAVALGFHAWRNLAHEAKFAPAAAADVFAEAIVSLASAPAVRNRGSVIHRGARARRGAAPVT